MQISKTFEDSFLGNETIREYARELADDMKMDPVSLREKSMTASAIRVKWLNYLYQERDNLKRAMEMKEARKSAKHGVEQKTFSMLPKKNDDELVKTDEVLRKLLAKIEQIKETVNYLEYAMNHSISHIGYDIKNAIEMQKLCN